MSVYHAKKRLGQHFLNSNAVIDRIVETIAPLEGQTIIEIGAGRGVLTVPLARSAAKVVAVEFDRDLIGVLKRAVLDFGNVQVVNRDFVRFDPTDLALGDFVLVGNLPYNITSPVMDWCISHRRSIVSAVFMVQKEMGARIAAAPGHKDWSPLAIFTQIYFDVLHCFDVSPRSFNPPPKVVSSVIRLVPKMATPELNLKTLEPLVRASFARRRKLLINNIVPAFFPSDDTAFEAFDTAGLAHNCRAEQVTIEQFELLAGQVVIGPQKH
jgi:16S rRNA (adenine1518-N6/adenine1519-N6)-dimethyltransferase